jgi:sirohydrochlorin ferrochelatase
MLAYPNHTVGIIVVDHGSKKSAANDQLLEVTELFRRVAHLAIVEPAHMELAEPTIAQAFDRCVAQGATLVLVHPYFLAPGRHSTTDIPRLTTEAAAKHPAVRFHVTQPLGLDETIAALMLRRVEHCLQHDLVCDYCRKSEAAKTAAPVSASV